MSGYSLTTNATLMCPHGGTVSCVPSNSTVTADNGAVVVQTDTCTITGCAFTYPNGQPNPCVRVQWVVADTRCFAGNTPLLSQGSTGLCMGANGAPNGTVVVASTQTRAQSM